MSRNKSIVMKRWLPACRQKRTDVGHQIILVNGTKAVFNPKVVTSLRDIKEDTMEVLPRTPREVCLNISTRAGRNKTIRAARRKATKEVRNGNNNNNSREYINTNKVRSLSTKVHPNT
jgi:hypothetical protein